MQESQEYTARCAPGQGDGGGRARGLGIVGAALSSRLGLGFCCLDGHIRPRQDVRGIRRSLVYGVTHAETEDETDVVGIFFRFTDIEAAGHVVKEVGFFGGSVEYVGGVTGPVAENGIYHETANPDGEVLVPGYLHDVRDLPDLNKGANTMLELIAAVKLWAGRPRPAELWAGRPRPAGERLR